MRAKTRHARSSSRARIETRWTYDCDAIGTVTPAVHRGRGLKHFIVSAACPSQRVTPAVHRGRGLKPITGTAFDASDASHARSSSRARIETGSLPASIVIASVTPAVHRGRGLKRKTNGPAAAGGSHARSSSRARIETLEVVGRVRRLGVTPAVHRGRGLKHKNISEIDMSVVTPAVHRGRGLKPG